MAIRSGVFKVAFQGLGKYGKVCLESHMILSWCYPVRPTKEADALRRSGLLKTANHSGDIGIRGRRNATYRGFKFPILWFQIFRNWNFLTLGVEETSRANKN